MGKVGSLVLLGGIYVASLILMTGLRPIHLVRQTVAATRRACRNCTNGSCAGSCAAPILKGQLEISQKELAKQRRVIEKQLKKKGAPVAEPPARLRFAGRTGQPPQAESGRYHRACRRNRERPGENRRWPNCAAAGDKSKAPSGLTSRDWNAENLHGARARFAGRTRSGGRGRRRTRPSSSGFSKF